MRAICQSIIDRLVLSNDQDRDHIRSIKIDKLELHGALIRRYDELKSVLLALSCSKRDPKRCVSQLHIGEVELCNTHTCPEGVELLRSASCSKINSGDGDTDEEEVVTSSIALVDHTECPLKGDCYTNIPLKVSGLYVHRRPDLLSEFLATESDVDFYGNKSSQQRPLPDLFSVYNATDKVLSNEDLYANMLRIEPK